MELLESVGPRPRQARYQAALRPDMKCCIDSKVLSNLVATLKQKLRKINPQGACLQLIYLASGSGINGFSIRPPFANPQEISGLYGPIVLC
jgi:hypothetical protein